MNRAQEQKILDGLRQAVIDGDVQGTEELARKTIKEGMDPLIALEEGLGKGMSIVGDCFGKGETFLPELVIGADAMQAGTNILVEELKSRGIKRKSRGKFLIGTASGDIHYIGKTLVATLLTTNGFEVIDIGEDKSAENFVEVVRQHRPDIVGISALLITTMLYQREVIEALSQADLRSVKVMVGGGPVTAEWAEEIGADAYGMNAADAVTKARALMDLNE